jgi:N12 class adenine-specific DNA methylase
MALEDALGATDPQTDQDPGQSLRDFIGQRAPDLAQNGAVDPQTVVNRLIRKQQDKLAQRAQERQKAENLDFAEFGADKEHANQGPDFAEFGMPAGGVQEPPRPNDQPEEAQAAPAQQPSTLGSIASSLGKAAVRGAVPLLGIPGALDAASTLGRAAARAPISMAGHALQGLATADTRITANEPAPKPEESSLYKAGEAVEQFGKNIPLTKEEQASFTGQVGSGLGTAGAVIGAAMIPGVPEAAAIVGGAALFGLSGVGETYKAAKEAGADEATARDAASKSGALQATLGSIPLAAVLRGFAPKAASLAVKMLLDGTIDAAAFTGIGELQTAIQAKIDQLYNPKAGYEFDPKRIAAEALTGGVLGAGHAGLEGLKNRGATNTGTGTGDTTADEDRRKHEESQIPEEEKAARTAAHQAWQKQWDETPAPTAEEQKRRAFAGMKDQLKRDFWFTDDELRNANLKDMRRYMTKADALSAKGFSKRDISTMAPEDVARGHPAGGLASDDEILRRFFTEDEIAGWSPEEKEAIIREHEGYGGMTGAEEAGPGTRDQPIDLKSAADVKRAGDLVNENYSHAQGEANNTQRVHVTWNGMDATLEAGAGGVRKGIAPDGTPYDQHFPTAHGYFKGTTGADGDHLDAYFGQHPTAPTVYVIDELDRDTGKFKQHKVFAGFQTPIEAIEAYKATDGKRPSQMGGMRALSIDEFREWRKGDLTRPVSDAIYNVSGGREPTAAGGVGVVGAKPASAKTGATSGPVRTPEPPEIHVTAAHREAIEKMLRENQIPTNTLRPRSIAHAAEIHAREGLAPNMAFKVAVARDLVADGLLAPEQVKEEFGEEVAAALSPRGASKSRPEARGTGTGGAAPAAPAAAPERVPGGEEARPAEGGAGPVAAEGAGKPGRAEAGEHPVRGTASGQRPPESTPREPRQRAEAPPRKSQTSPKASSAPLIGQPVEKIGDHKVTAADGASVKVKPVVVEAADLITSADKGYDAALQPRQRDRAASQAQIREIATKLDPERLGYSAEADRGAPIVGPDKMVESGNGRVLALRKIYGVISGHGANAKKYRDWLTAQGVDVSKYKEPVLVRQRVSDLDEAERRDFVVAANQAATLSMSAPERAMADAGHVTPDMLDQIRDSDLGSLENRAFVRSFVGALPASERGNLTSAGGGLSAEGLTRVRNAILAKAYGDADILARITESTDDDVKSISNALTAAAPTWAKMRAEIDAGRTPEELDITADLLEAVKRTADVRSKGMKIDDYLAQEDAFDTYKNDVDYLVRLFYDPRTRRALGTAKIAEALEFYAREAAKVSTEEGLALGIPKVTSNELKAAAAAKTQGASARAHGQEGGGVNRPTGAGENGPRTGDERMGRRLAEPEPKYGAEPGAEGRPQLVIPGSEQRSGAELARRRAGEPLKPKVAQKPLEGGLFGDQRNQLDLLAQPKPHGLTELDMALQKADDAWSAELQKAFGKEAGDKRYGAAGKGEPGSALRKAYDVRDAARQAYEAEKARVAPTKQERAPAASVEAKKVSEAAPSGPRELTYPEIIDLATGPRFLDFMRDRFGPKWEVRARRGVEPSRPGNTVINRAEFEAAQKEYAQKRLGELARPQNAFPDQVAPPAPPPQITEKPKKAGQTSLFDWETPDERPRTGKSGPKALGGVAPGEGPQTQAGGQVPGGGARGGRPGAKGNRAPDAGPSLFDFGGAGSGAPAAHPPTAGGSAGGRRAGGGVAGNGARVPKESAPRLPDVKPEQAPSVPAVNYRITNETELGKGSEGVKFWDNIAAIETLKKIEAEDRRPTSAEQRILARYVGWGGLANAFRQPGTNEFKPDWKERGETLEPLLTKEELRAAQHSTLAAHYTSKAIVDAAWKIAERLGFKGGLALESSMGTGNFLGLIPERLAGQTHFIGAEIDSITARIAKALYPQETVLHTGFEKLPLPDGEFVLSIGNPPFGKESLRFQHKPELYGQSIHNQFFLASLDALQPGGLHIAVVSHYLLDAQVASAREKMAVKADLLGAIRLPDTAFKENARTEVVTDLVAMQRRTPEEEKEIQDLIDATQAPGKSREDADLRARARGELQRKVPWLDTEEVKDPLGGEPLKVNRYFADHPDMIVGRLERSGTMRAGGKLNVKLADKDEYQDLLDKAVERLPKNKLDLGKEVIDRTLKRFETLSDSIKIALRGLEPGHLEYDDKGALTQIAERETANGDFEPIKRVVDADTPWSRQLMMDNEGRWFTLEPKVDAKGVRVKQGTRNVYERKYFPNNEVPQPLRLGATRFDRVSDLTRMRDALRRQIEIETQDAPAKVMEGNRGRLAAAYRGYTDKNGLLHDPSNMRLLNEMPDGPLLMSLESGYRPAITNTKAARTGGKVRKASAKQAAILSKRVILKYEPPDKAASPADALAISLSERGFIDVPRVAKLLDIPEDKVGEALSAGDKPLAFYDPELQRWEPRSAYLSGQVRRKLAAARGAGLEKNVKELEAVQPEEWTADQVTPLMGSNWIPPKVYEDFAKHLLGVDSATVNYAKATNAFNFLTSEYGEGKHAEWGTPDMPPDAIIRGLLNSKLPKVMAPTYGADGRVVGEHVDKEATALVALKAREITQAFADWVYRDGDRRRELVGIYNDKMNTRTPRQHDGRHLTLPGKSPDISLRRHIYNAIWRGIYERNMLVDHVVGAGKTFTTIGMVMEKRRMGLVKKPMIAVPNHLVEQWASEAYRLYPGARVLAAGKNQFDKKNRRKLFARIATGDWDMVIVPHSSFGFIKIAPETETRFLEEELRVAQQALADAEADAPPGRFKHYTVKEAERLVSKIEARLAGLRGGRRDSMLTFEQMGVDHLVVDEAHEFKNLFYSSRMQGVRGMGDKSGSQKAFDLYNKIKVLNESPTGAVTFLTGTPISNSAVEMYTMMRYLAAKELRELGLEHFDAWRSQFVSAEPKWEPTESGHGLKEVTRLGRSWSNMRALMDLYHSFTDSVTQEDINRWYAEDNNGADFPIPKVAGGGMQTHVLKPTAAQIMALGEIINGFDHLDDISDQKERNAERLRLMDRARKVSLDVRAVDANHPSKEEGGKLEVTADEVARIYKKWNKDKGTQLIFLDRSVPKSRGDAAILKQYDKLIAKRRDAIAANDEEGERRANDELEKYDPNEMAELRRAQQGGWNAYQQLKDNLIARGVPADEIRFMQEANNDAEKKEMIDSVNAGEVRVLIGSTQRMGAGMNAQERIVGGHHEDVTWKPSDIEQRRGRWVRQGNKLLEKYGKDFELEEHNYVTERTIDAKMWDLNAEKLRMVNGIRKYDGSFEMDFADEEAVSMAEIAALASGDPMLLERVKLSGEIEKLEMQERGFRRKMDGIEDAIDRAKRSIADFPEAIAKTRAAADDMQARRDVVEAEAAKRSITIEGKKYDESSRASGAANKAAQDIIDAQKGGDENAKYKINVDGEDITNQKDLTTAFANAFGDFEPFEATIGGKTFTRRWTAAKELTPKVMEAPDGNLKLGRVLGADLEAEIASGDQSTQMVFGLTDGGKTISASELHNIPKDLLVDAGAFTRAIEKALHEIDKDTRSVAMSRGDWMQARIDAAEKALPELEAQQGQQSPYAGKLAEMRDKLRGVIAELARRTDHPAEYEESQIVNPIDRKATPEEKARQLQALSEANKPIVQDFIDQIDRDFGTESKWNEKLPENIISKGSRPSILKQKPWHGIEHLRDSFRFKTILNDIRELPEIAARLPPIGASIIKSDTAKVLKPKEWGFRIAVFDLRMPNGQLVEYYLPIREMEAAKKEGHKLFERWRNRDQADLSEQETKDMAADMQRSRDLYQGAWDAYLARTGISESEVRAALSKVATSEGSETGVQSAASSPTVIENRSQAPEERTAENLSDVSNTYTTERSWSPTYAPEAITPSTENIGVPNSTGNMLRDRWDIPVDPNQAPFEWKSPPRPAPAGPMVAEDRGPFYIDPNRPAGQQAQDYLLRQGISTGLEHLLAIDEKGNAVLHLRGQAKNVAFDDDMLKAFADANNRLAVHHTHPSNGALSEGDIGMLGWPGVESIWAHGHGGNVTRGALTDFGRSLLGPDAKHNAASLGRIASFIGQKQILPLLTELVHERKLLPIATANKMHHVLIGEVLRQAGILHFHTTNDYRAEIKDLGLQPYIKQAADTLRRSIPNAASQPRPGDDRSTGNVFRHLGDVGATFERRAPAPAGRPEPRVADRASGGNGRAQAPPATRQLDFAFAHPENIVGFSDTKDLFRDKHDMQKHVVFGLPLNPLSALEQLKGCSFCVSYGTRIKLGKQLDDAIRLVGKDGILLVDNGAFSMWRRGEGTFTPEAVEGFEKWAQGILDRSPQAVAVIPDIIGGTEQENARLVRETNLPSDRAMPIWHMHESLDYLRWLLEGGFNHLGIGSSGDFKDPGTPEWHRRIDEALAFVKQVEDENGNGGVRPRIHMMRAQSQAHLYPFDSSDSTNVAVNHGRYRETHPGPEHIARMAGGIKERIEGSATGESARHQELRPLDDHTKQAAWEHDKQFADLANWFDANFEVTERQGDLFGSGFEAPRTNYGPQPPRPRGASQQPPRVGPPRPITGGIAKMPVAKQVKAFWMKSFQPELFSDDAMRALPVIAKFKSASQSEKDGIIDRDHKDWEYWNKQPAAEGLRWMKEAETGQRPTNLREALMAAHYRNAMDTDWALGKQYGSQADFVENYFPHVWQKPDDYSAWARTQTAQHGPTWFQKKRTYELIEDGLAAGMKLKFPNPIDAINHRLISGADQRNKMAMIYELKKMGLAWEGSGSPATGAMVKRGWQIINAPDRKQWVIAPDVQQLWKNMVDAKGLWMAQGFWGGTFRAWMGLKNVWVPIKLSLSAFHPLHVVGIDWANGTARAVSALVKGHDPATALKALMDAPLGPFWTHPRRGAEGRAAWLKADTARSPYERYMVSAMNDGGFIPQMDEQQKIAASKAFKEAYWRIRKGEAGVPDWAKYFWGGMRLPIELTQKALFEKWIPALKTNAYLEAYADLMRRNPQYQLDDVSRRVAAHAIAKSIDNRYGEMNYKNLPWDPILADAAKASFLSLGWNLGFVREFGGAAMEAGTRPLGRVFPAFAPSGPRKIARDATNKIPFALAYVAISAMLAGLITWLMTGEKPTGDDYTFPRIGGLNPDGSPRRVTTMFYNRELPMLQKHIQERGGNIPMGAAAMLWNKQMYEPFVEMWNNRNYYGYNITDENAPWYQRTWQLLKHIYGDQFNPMSVSGAKHAASLSGHPFPSKGEIFAHPEKLWDAITSAGVGLSVLGFGPAPAYVEKNAIQNRIAYLYNEGQGKKSFEKGENMEAMMEARQSYLIAKRDKDWTGTQEARQKLIKLGMKPDSISKLGTESQDVYQFSRLDNEDQKAILQQATTEERHRYWPRPTKTSKP